MLERDKTEIIRDAERERKKILEDFAQKYREMKRFNAKISKWGLSLGVRIPKELVKKYNLKGNSNVVIIPEKDGIRIIPA